MLQVLEENLNRMRDTNPGQMISFLQDNCPIHTARIVRDWFEDHADVIELIQHPAYSPDLNPIENLWGRITLEWKNIGYRGVRERNAEQLSQHVNEIWAAMANTNICEVLVGSMRRRLQACIEAEGYYTKY